MKTGIGVGSGRAAPPAIEAMIAVVPVTVELVGAALRFGVAVPAFCSFVLFFPALFVAVVGDEEDDDGDAGDEDSEDHVVGEDGAIFVQEILAPDFCRVAVGDTVHN